jgi:hypothetical protein
VDFGTLGLGPRRDLRIRLGQPSLDLGILTLERPLDRALRGEAAAAQMSPTVLIASVIPKRTWIRSRTASLLHSANGSFSWSGALVANQLLDRARLRPAQQHL